MSKEYVSPFVPTTIEAAQIAAAIEAEVGMLYTPQFQMN
jgi:hypothetical protein